MLVDIFKSLNKEDESEANRDAGQDFIYLRDVRNPLVELDDSFQILEENVLPLCVRHSVTATDPTQNAVIYTFAITF